MESSVKSEKSNLNQEMITKFVEIDEQSFNLNEYAEKLQQFEELLENFSQTPQKLKTDKEYFSEMEPILTNSLQAKSENFNIETVFFNRFLISVKKLQNLVKIINEWDTSSLAPIETNFYIKPREKQKNTLSNSKSKIKILEMKLEMLKNNLMKFEFQDIKNLQEEIQKLQNSKESEEDPYLFNAKLSKLNRNLIILKYF